jgi:hypothetical protein
VATPPVSPVLRRASFDQPREGWLERSEKLVERTPQWRGNRSYVWSLTQLAGRLD